MTKLQITYNPYTVETEILIDGKSVDKASAISYVEEKRLQEWIEPKENWKGIFKELRQSIGESEIHVDFIGTFDDFNDLEYAKNHYGDCFELIELEHANKDTASEIDPYEKLDDLEDLYKELIDGPVEEFKTDDIRDNFKNAMDSEFRIVVVAPMSSGKSTLINAMLERDLLPAVNQATTAVLTEIKDNDALPNFKLKAWDKNGRLVREEENADKETVSELNYMKDPDDPEGKSALIRKIQLEGDIPGLPSTKLNTVFVDTPGGNNSQNAEHEELMDEAIGDENKAMILYVFNGTQLGTDDSDRILSKIAEAMKNGRNGKQSRDRFIFVANRMDDIDVDNESYESLINDTILPHLQRKGIIDPNLYLVSAQAAKLIRIKNHGGKLSKNEQRHLNAFIDQFNDSESYALPKYSSLNSFLKNQLLGEAEAKADIIEQDENCDADALMNRVAEINSGVPAVEAAIKEYLEKYALTIKIKTAHDTFMKKVIESNMVLNFEKKLAEDKNKRDNIIKEIAEKKKKLNSSNMLLKSKDQIRKIKFDPSDIIQEQVNYTESIKKIADNSKRNNKVSKDTARKIVKQFQEEINNLSKKSLNIVEHSLETVVKNSCSNVVNKYAAYIKDLNYNGFLNIGEFDIKKTTAFCPTIDMDDFIFEDKVFVGTRKEPKDGLRAKIARKLHLGGYIKIDEYAYRDFVRLNDLIEEQLTLIDNSFNQNIESIIDNANKRVDKVKCAALNQLDNMNKQISQLMSEIEKNAKNHQELTERVKQNEKKAEWINKYVAKVDKLLSIK